MSDLCESILRRFDAGKAIRAQRKLANKIILKDDFNPIRVVVGLDAAYVKGNPRLGVGVAVALSYPSMRLIDCQAYVTQVCVPYIPGLLAFREAAVLVPALIRLLKRTPADLLIVDGHGIAHPRKLGIASHIGVAFNLPSIGVAKKKLYGKIIIRDSKEYIVDDSGSVLGTVLRSRRGSKIYVSPGHRITPDTAAKLVSSMMKLHKLPEPTYVADSISKSIRSSITSKIGYIQCYDSNSRSISS